MLLILKFMADEKFFVVFDPESVDLESFRIHSLPNSVYYIPDFLNLEEERYLLQKVYDAPKPKWTQLSNRRLQNWGGHPHPKGMISEDLPLWLQMYARKIAKFGCGPDHRKKIFPKEPNHVLVNEYLSGQGVMPHVDGPVFYPVISTINLGSHTVLDFYHMSDISTSPSFTAATDVDQPNSQERTGLESRFAFSLLLQPRSLLISSENIYTDFLHGIRALKKDCLGKETANLSQCEMNVGDVLDRGTRLSLTIRLAQKTSKFKLSVFKT